MGNTAAVLNERKRDPVEPAAPSSWVDKHRRLQTQSEWEEYLRHYAKRMHRTRKCMHCFVEFKNIPSLLTHLGTAHCPTMSYSTNSVVVSETDRLLCFKCSKTFVSTKALKSHQLKPCDDYLKTGETKVSKDARMKGTGQKRPKIRKSIVEVTKRQKTQPSLIIPKEKRLLDDDNFIIPSQIHKKVVKTQATITAELSKKSVKTINSTSCIRQYSRPINPVADVSNSGKSSCDKGKLLSTHLLCGNYQKDSYNGVKFPIRNSQQKSHNSKNVVYKITKNSTRSTGYVDMTKLRTTARTKLLNQMQSTKSSAEFTNLNGASEDTVGAVSTSVNFNKVTQNSKTEIGSSVQSQTSTSKDNKDANILNSIPSNGLINKDGKSYLFLKVMPIVQQQSPSSSTSLKKILPKQNIQQYAGYKKIQPRPQIVLQNTPKPLLVLNVPDLNVTKERVGDKGKVSNGLFNPKNPIKAGKTYGFNPTKKKTTKKDDAFDEII